jgi:hypothetical protein
VEKIVDVTGYGNRRRGCGIVVWSRIARRRNSA